MRRYNEKLLRELYEYIMEYQKENGASPSYREIMSGIPRQFTSSAKVKGYVDILNRRGKIWKQSDGSIAVDCRFRRKTTVAALVGKVACGQPITAVENIEGVYSLSPEIFGSDNLMLLRAEGQSMKDVGIDDGDLIVLRQQDTAEYGQMVLALIDDSATVKTFHPQQDGSVVLHPENKSYNDIFPDECLIQGIVVGCIKTY